MDARNAALFAVICTLGCTKPSTLANSNAPANPAASASTLPAPSAASPEVPSAKASVSPPLASCAALGPMACSAPPTSRAKLCKESGPCILQHAPHPEHFEDLTFDCMDAAFTEPAGAPALAPTEERPAVSLINMVALSGGMTIQFTASFLVAELPQGACLVDVVHDWEMSRSYAETALETRWGSASSGARLELQSRRIVHESLDAEESEQGVSDVFSDYCEQRVYVVAGGKLTRVADSSHQGACPAAAGE